MAKGSRGGKGRASGGSGIKEQDIISRTSLLSYDESKQKEIGEVMTTVKDVYSKFGTILEDLHIAKLKPKEDGTIAFFGGDILSINEKYFNSTELNKKYDASTETGWSPSRGNKTGLQAVVAHELGHKLNYDISLKMKTGNRTATLDEAATRIVNEARAITKDRGVVIMANKISRYASTSNAEAVAEACSDVYCNGSKASSASKAIFKVMKKYL